MHFLGFYNLSAALAIAGVCGVFASPPAAAHEADPCYWVWDDNNGAWIPSADAVLSTPPSRVDNGYWSAFYWNRVYDQPTGYYIDAQYPTEDAPEGEGYGYYGPGADVTYANAGPAAADYRAVVTYADTGTAAAADYRADYAANAGDYGGPSAAYYQRNAVVDYYALHHRHHEHREAAVRAQDNWRDRPPVQTNAGPARIDNRYDSNRVDRGYPVHVTHDNRGFNGHDQHMFEDHRPVKPVATGYQVHDKPHDKQPPHQN